MSKKKICIFAALFCIAAGLLLSFFVLVAIRFDFGRLNTVKITTDTYEVGKSFSSIQIDDVACDIRFEPSQDGACRVVCVQDDKMTHDVNVDGQTLKISYSSSRKWYDFVWNFTWGWNNLSVTVYLPEGSYENLHIKTTSGDITVPDCFAFTKGADIASTSGNIRYAAVTERGLSVKTVSGEQTVSNLASGELKAQSTSGDISLSEILADNVTLKTTSGDLSLNQARAAVLTVQSTSGEVCISALEDTQSLAVQTTSGDVSISALEVRDDVTLKTTSGSLQLERAAAQNVSAQSTSGDVELDSVIATKRIEVKTVSGCIELPNSDAQSLTLQSTSGDVSGTLLSGKKFVTRTTSGSVRVPPDPTDGGTCEVKTVSGDIRFIVAEEEKQ